MHTPITVITMSALALGALLTTSVADPHPLNTPEPIAQAGMELVLETGDARTSEVAAQGGLVAEGFAVTLAQHDYAGWSCPELIDERNRIAAKAAREARASASIGPTPVLHDLKNQLGALDGTLSWQQCYTRIVARAAD
ncbi:MAG: hypothetical protein MRY63_06025 [Neomegalonema sp.]|nr:hypothetical protein [Neomegalonema sp.]